VTPYVKVGLSNTPGCGTFPHLVPLTGRLSRLDSQLPHPTSVFSHVSREILLILFCARLFLPQQSAVPVQGLLNNVVCNQTVLPRAGVPEDNPDMVLTRVAFGCEALTDTLVSLREQHTNDGATAMMGMWVDHPVYDPSAASGADIDLASLDFLSEVLVFPGTGVDARTNAGAAAILLGLQPAELAPVLVSRRLPTRNLPCAPGKFLSAAGSVMRPAICTPWLNCQDGTFEARPGSATQDRICQAITVCKANEQEVAPPASTADRQCRVVRHFDF